MIHRLLNLFLRGGGMVGKFLLIFFLARILPPEELGVYGLFTATVSYALYFLGLDFYTYSGRAMLHSEQTLWPTMLRDQAVLFACSYLLVFPLLWLLFVTEFLSIKYALLFYVLLTTEHLAQELNRLLIIIGKPLAAGAFSFIRSGAWCYLLVALYLAGLISVDIEMVLRLWIAANTLVMFGGFLLLRKLPWSNLKSGINWAWIYRGLRVAALFLVGTLALRGIFTLDRYFVEMFAGQKMLGVYTLYFGICNSLIGFVDAAVFSFRYPELVALYKSDLTAFKLTKRKFAYQTLIAVTVLASFAGLLIVPVLEWLGKPIYLQHLPVFFVLLAASVVFVIGHIPHYVLYAMGQDSSIVYAHFIGFCIFVVLISLLAPIYGIEGIAISLSITLLVISVLKQWKLTLLKCKGNSLYYTNS